MAGLESYVLVRAQAHQCFASGVPVEVLCLVQLCLFPKMEGSKSLPFPLTSTDCRTKRRVPSMLQP